MALSCFYTVSGSWNKNLKLQPLQRRYCENSESRASVCVMRRRYSITYTQSLHIINGLLAVGRVGNLLCGRPSYMQVCDIRDGKWLHGCFFLLLLLIIIIIVPQFTMCSGHRYKFLSAADLSIDTDLVKHPDVTPVLNFGEVRKAQLATSTLLTSTLVPLGFCQIF